jgi:hypothetical protein
MRIIIVSALAMALAACGGNDGGNGSATSGPDEVSTTTTSKLVLGEDGVPKFKAGLWEITGGGEGKEGEVERQCLGSETNEELREAVTREFDKECKVERRSGPEGIYIKASCPSNGATIDAVTDIKGSDTNFDMKINMGVTMPDGSKQDTAMAASGRWVGECPAGMEPSDKAEDSGNSEQ